jgi:hypothetical protein
MSDTPPPAAKRPRNLVLLLTGGHTVRIHLRDDDLTKYRTGRADVERFLDTMPAMTVIPFSGDSEVNGLIMAYIEDPTFPAYVPGTLQFEPPNDFQRIEVNSPGDVGSAA